MQNILDIKYKLEEQAKQNYMAVQARLNNALEEERQLNERKDGYMVRYLQLVSEKLDVLEIENCKNSILIMDDYIHLKQQEVKIIERELEQAIALMNQAMQERKIHEKLKERQFEVFMEELNAEESKEIDQLVSFQYNNREEEEV